MAGVKAMSQGYKQKKMMGSPNQQGGVIAINPKNEVLYFFRSAHAGDHPRWEDVLNSLN